MMAGEVALKDAMHFANLPFHPPKMRGTKLAILAGLTMNTLMDRVRNGGYFPAGLPAVGLLFLRIFAGYALAQHGFTKISDPLHWMDKMPGHPPGILQALAAVSEFFGGLALIFGAFTPLACFGVMCTMFVAALKHFNDGDALIAGKGEPAALYFIVALTLFMTGPGLLSFDYFVFGRKKEAVQAV